MMLLQTISSLRLHVCMHGNGNVPKRKVVQDGHTSSPIAKTVVAVLVVRSLWLESFASTPAMDVVAAGWCAPRSVAVGSGLAAVLSVAPRGAVGLYLKNQSPIK